MSHRINVPELAHSTKSVIAHKVIFEDRSARFSLTRNSNLEEATWLALWDECINRGRIILLPELLLNARTFGQIAKVEELSDWTTLQRVCTDARFSNSSEELKLAVRSNPLYEGTLESLVGYTGNTLRGLEPTEELYIQEVIDPSLDKLGENGWTVFIGMLPTWNDTIVELLRAVDSLCK